MITIKEIAELAKVSTGTVDRVIHNRAGVSKKNCRTHQSFAKRTSIQIE